MRKSLDIFKPLDLSITDLKASLTKQLTLEQDMDYFCQGKPLEDSNRTLKDFKMSP